LVAHPRKGNDRLAELDAINRIGKPKIEGVLGNADGAGGGLDARRFEGPHQLLESLAFDAAEKAAHRHFEILEANLVFLHAAIAEDSDLAAAHAVGGKGIVVA